MDKEIEKVEVKNVGGGVKRVPISQLLVNGTVRLNSDGTSCMEVNVDGMEAFDLRRLARYLGILRSGK